MGEITVATLRRSARGLPEKPPRGIPEALKRGSLSRVQERVPAEIPERKALCRNFVMFPGEIPSRIPVGILEGITVESWVDSLESPGRNIGINLCVILERNP